MDTRIFRMYFSRFVIEATRVALESMREEDGEDES